MVEFSPEFVSEGVDVMRGAFTLSADEFGEYGFDISERLSEYSRNGLYRSSNGYTREMFREGLVVQLVQENNTLAYPFFVSEEHVPPARSRFEEVFKLTPLCQLPRGQAPRLVSGLLL